MMCSPSTGGTSRSCGPCTAPLYGCCQTDPTPDAWSVRAAIATIGAVAPAGDRDLTLVWMDLELTGLSSNPDGDSILEAAIAVTGSVPALETPVRDFVIWQPESLLERMSPAVRTMHTLNGLIDRVRLSTQTLAEVEDELLKIIAGSCPPGQATLAGTSVWV